jgi:hypothetical protein
VSQDPGGVSRRHLGTLFSVGVTAGLTDGQLLERFATGTGEASEMAFGALGGAARADGAPHLPWRAARRARGA